MSVKGLKEALAKKQAQKTPGSQPNDDTEKNSLKTARSNFAASKPLKKATGRGR